MVVGLTKENLFKYEVLKGLAQNAGLYVSQVKDYGSGFYVDIETPIKGFSGNGVELVIYMAQNFEVVKIPNESFSIYRVCLQS